MEQARYISKVKFSGELNEFSYLNNISVVKELKRKGELRFTSNITFLVGENGTGKSTLLESMAVASGFNPEGGTKNSMYSTKDTHSELHNHLTMIRRGYPKAGYFLRAESFYNTLSYLDTLNIKNESFHAQSHGETFLSTIENCFKSQGLYFLDEPEAALSIRNLFVLMTVIHQLAQEGSQFIIATHSPILMSIPGSTVIELNDEGFHEVNFKETEHFQLSQQFYQNPDRILHYLFG